MKNKLILLILMICVAVLFGCDNSVEPKATATPNPTQAPTATPDPTATPTPAPTPEPGTNVALNCPFEVSSHTGDTHTQWGWNQSFINDGNTKLLPYENVGWTTQVGAIMSMDAWVDQWALFDIGGNYLIDKVVIWPIENTAPFFPIDYHVEVSTDNNNYVTVISVEGDLSTAQVDASPKELTFEPVEARYVRVVFTKPYDVPNADGYLIQLAEIEIFTAPSN